MAAAGATGDPRVDVSRFPVVTVRCSGGPRDEEDLARLMRAVDGAVSTGGERQRVLLVFDMRGSTLHLHLAAVVRHLRRDNASRSGDPARCRILLRSHPAIAPLVRTALFVLRRRVGYTIVPCGSDAEVRRETRLFAGVIRRRE